MTTRKSKECVHLKCHTAQHARGVCKRHYDQLHAFTHDKAKVLRERPLRRSELVGFDQDDYWAWVKQELQLL